MKPCKMFYDMGELGIEEFEFMSWEEAFDFWKEQKPPGPLVRTIYLLNLRGIDYRVEVSPPGHYGTPIILDAKLIGWMPVDSKRYSGEQGMRLGYPIKNAAFIPKLYQRAVEDKEWDEIYFRKTGHHWQEHEEAKHGTEGGSKMTSEQFSLNRSDCLKILSLKPEFTKKELSTAYKKTVQRYHPDKVGPHVETLPKEFKDLAEHKTKQINSAYELLMKDFK